MKATLIIIDANLLTYSRPHPEEESHHGLVTAASQSEAELGDTDQ